MLLISGCYFIFIHCIVLLVMLHILTSGFSIFLCLHFYNIWGFYAHKKINRQAVYTLPTELSKFYKRHIYYLSEHAVDADKRVYVAPEEGPKHYIDLDQYDGYPEKMPPLIWEQAVQLFSKDSLLDKGTLPWQINFTYRSLVSAFKEHDLTRILRHSADIGHYLADAHVPLHTTSNYNGQQSNQIGIHAFWESRLPELFADDYNLLVGRATYIDNIQQTAWNIINNSHSLLDSVLLLERQLSTTYAKRTKYNFEERNNLLVRTHSKKYSNQYHFMLNGMVEKQMKSAIYQIGNFWYSAWVDAGQPSIDALLRKEKSNNDLPTDSSLHAAHFLFP